MEFTNCNNALPRVFQIFSPYALPEDFEIFSEIEKPLYPLVGAVGIEPTTR